MTHLDIAVEDLEAGVAWGRDTGARLADFQPQKHVSVMLDPVGHPFCLFPAPSDRPACPTRCSYRLCLPGPGPWGNWQCSARFLKTV